MTFIEREIVDIAIDLVALWDSPNIRALPRSERNAAIEETRARLTDAVHRLNAKHHLQLELHETAPPNRKPGLR